MLRWMDGPASKSAAGAEQQALALSSLGPRMDELFLAALRELAAPRPRSAAVTAFVT
jgi:hypothetical protein